jgi:hypothetical protein
MAVVGPDDELFVLHIDHIFVQVRWPKRHLVGLITGSLRLKEDGLN